jgi:copper chaperone
MLRALTHCEGVEMRTVVFRVEGMQCDACANSIKSRIERELGVRAVSVSFSERLARVLYDPRIVAESRLACLIQDSGFQVLGHETVGESLR